MKGGSFVNEDWYEELMKKVERALGKVDELPEPERSIEAFTAMIETMRVALFGPEEDEE